MCACHQATCVFTSRWPHSRASRCIAAVYCGSPSRTRSKSRRVADRSLRLRHTANDQSAALLRPCASLSTCCPSSGKRILAVQSELCRSSPSWPPATARGSLLIQEPAEITLPHVAVSRAMRSGDRSCAIPALWRPVPAVFSSRDLSRQVCLGNPIIVARSEHYVKSMPVPLAA
jgi:hypothetical protein